MCRGQMQYRARRAPLLLTGGELDHIVPAALNRANAARCDAIVAPTKYTAMKGRAHYCGQPGSDEVEQVTQRFVERYINGGLLVGTVGIAPTAIDL